ncbi:hypothetical protein E1A91_D11G017700v1 [Gossypium mustelinum]|uniref:TMPIT-like protein n=5 Tax=Gossypium TaxID=3633 RepID=A0A5D2SKZ0_GOSMU|nr:hypothetical protein E1A91_D11G017700v1 [Gossypium mustelinum]TYI53618.1 hypothetical protein E1A91_D11G017700v1 [Gossypium mustelinum]TYI53619.1 hypothetical protein E1A91_D11G017700v1 [Gossypium mustelinum]
MLNRTHSLFDFIRITPPKTILLENSKDEEMQRANESASASASASADKFEEEVGRVMEQARELHESGASLLWKISNEEQSLRQKAISLESSIRRVRSSINSLVSKKLLDPKFASKLEEDLQRASSILTDGEAAAFLPAKAQGRFLRMFLGPINVRASRKEVQLKVKEEYNSYRDRTAFLFLLFPLTLLILKSWIWEGCLPAFPVQLYEAWLLFLYTGLAMRENILRANGSDIRPWWIYHHYCAMLMALVSLTWEIKRQPNCAQKQRGVELFLQWAMMQGVAMLLQNRYQRQRLYTRIALGKANRMDVVWGETSGVDGQLWVLCPILFVMQGFEAYVGLLLLKTAFVGVVTEWQVICCGILLVLMAVGNFINTIQTLMTKSRFKAKMKRSKSKAELD